MKLSEKGLGEDLELDMSPMIDMVFLLLIFFIVASQVIDEKPDVKVPTAAYSKVPENTAGRLMVTITSDNKIFNGQAPVTLEELTEQIAAGIEADENLRILIRADGETPYKYTEKVTIACAEAGANDLIYSAFEE